MRLGIIGGSGVYTPFLIKELMSAFEGMPIEKIILNGRSLYKLEIIKNVCDYLMEKNNKKIVLSITTDRKEAIRESDIVLCQIRVGGMESRAFDENLSCEFNIPSEETIGPGGLSNAIRTIPVILEIADEVEKYNNKALFIVLSNPLSMILRALRNKNISFVGICDLPQQLIDNISNFLNCNRNEIMVEYFGLNHLGWIKKVYFRGTDVTQYIADNFEKIDRGIEKELVKEWGLLPVSYLRYYVHGDKVLSDIKEKISRTMQLIVLEKEAMEKFKKMEFDEGLEILSKRSTVWYKYISGLINALVSENWTYHIINVKNNNTYLFLPEEAIIETGCVIKSGVIYPLPAKNIPIFAKMLITQINTYEELVVEGIIRKNPKLLIQALMLHPYGISFEKAKTIVEKIIKKNKEMGFVTWG